MLRAWIESGKIWIGVVVGLLLLNVSICAVTFVLATSDPVASAVEPDYYQKAVDWDRSRAEWPSPEKLGWAISLWDRGIEGVEIVVTHRATGSPVTALRGRVEARHAGETLEVRSDELAAAEGGRLMWKPGEIDPGLWTISVWLEREDVRTKFTQPVMIGG